MTGELVEQLERDFVRGRAGGAVYVPRAPSHAERVVTDRSLPVLPFRGLLGLNPGGAASAVFRLVYEAVHFGHDLAKRTELAAQGDGSHAEGDVSRSDVQAPAKLLAQTPSQKQTSQLWALRFIRCRLCPLWLLRQASIARPACCVHPVQQAPGPDSSIAAVLLPRDHGGC